jgi:hypothetical protein
MKSETKKTEEKQKKDIPKNATKLPQKKKVELKMTVQQSQKNNSTSEKAVSVGKGDPISTKAQDIKTMAEAKAEE